MASDCRRSFQGSGNLIGRDEDSPSDSNGRDRPVLDAAADCTDRDPESASGLTDREGPRSIAHVACGLTAYGRCVSELDRAVDLLREDGGEQEPERLG